MNTLGLVFGVKRGDTPLACFLFVLAVLAVGGVAYALWRHYRRCDDEEKHPRSRL